MTVIMSCGEVKKKIITFFTLGPLLAEKFNCKYVQLLSKTSVLASCARSITLCWEAHSPLFTHACYGYWAAIPNYQSNA